MDNITQVRTCRTCKEVFTVASMTDGWCRECYNAYQREYRRNNPEKIQAANKRNKQKRKLKLVK